MNLKSAGSAAERRLNKPEIFFLEMLRASDS
jgi:hypothetical protein